MPAFFNSTQKPRRGAVTAEVVPAQRLEGDSLREMFGFSIVGLLLACILALLVTDSRYNSLTFPLVVMSAPLAAMLGVGLGRPD